MPLLRLALRSTPRRSVVAVLAVVLLLQMAPIAAVAAEEPASFDRMGQAQDETMPHSRSHILVRLAAPSQASRALGTGSDPVGEGWFEVPVPAGQDAIDFAQEMSAHPDVEVAELDLILTQQATPPFVSPDPYYVNSGSPFYQWHLHAANVGTAWQSTVGAGVTVAILDTGVSEGTDGFCNPFVAEYNAVTQVAGPGAASDTDPDGHGSHVAGSVAQCSDNGIEGAGMAPGARIMPVEVFSAGGAAAADVVRGMDWAVAHGARVINMSLGCPGCASTALNEAIDRAAAAGVVLVASSGNNPIDVFYPANHPSVIGVGASTRSGNVASYSARGLGLDLLGPGGDESGFVWQDTIAGYEGLAGTSMAAAHVSGAAALLVSRFPTAPAGQVRNALLCSAHDIGSPGWDGASGYGRLDAGAAVEQLRLMVEASTLGCVGQPASNAPFGLIQSNAGYWRLHRGSAEVAAFYFGNPGDFGFMGDWDCDGIDTPGLYRRSDGYVYLRNSNTQGVADIAFFFGNPGDLPLAGDFDGDGCDTVSIYRPSQGRFFIINHLGKGDSGLGAADYSFLYGNPGDAPFMGDWNGDGIDTPGLRRSSNGFVYLRNTNTQGNANISYFYGNTGDLVFSGDWDGDGDDTLGLYRPSNGTIYLRNTNNTGIANWSFGAGSGMQPTGGDF